MELVRRFYQQFSAAVVGVEASGKAAWFEQLMNELGHELRVGNPTLIRARARSRHKSDKRDADLLLDLLLKDEFPSIWRRSMHGQSVLEQLRFRHHLVKHRTQVCNRLQALAHTAGLPKKGIQTKRARIALMAANFTETQSFERDQLFELLDDISGRIKQIEHWLEEKAKGERKVELLLTHKGIGILSALVVVYTLGDISRFPSSKEVVAYTGLDPSERSSAGKVRMGSRRTSRQFCAAALARAGDACCDSLRLRVKSIL
jgi:transposase